MLHSSTFILLEGIKGLLLIRQSSCNFNASGFNYASEITFLPESILFCSVLRESLQCAYYCYCCCCCFMRRNNGKSGLRVDLCSIDAKLSYNPDKLNFIDEYMVSVEIVEIQLLYGI